MLYYKKIEDKHLFDGITSYRLAKILGVSQSYISRIKNNKVVVSEDQYNKLVIAKNKYLTNKVS